MKKIFRHLLLQCTFLGGYRFYRKYVGGIWYLIYDPSSGTGFAGHVSFWTQEIPEGDWEIYKTEEFK